MDQNVKVIANKLKMAESSGKPLTKVVIYARTWIFDESGNQLGDDF